MTFGHVFIQVHQMHQGKLHPEDTWNGKKVVCMRELGNEMSHFIKFSYQSHICSAPSNQSAWNADVYWVLLSITSMCQILFSSHFSEILGRPRQINWALWLHHSKQLHVHCSLSQPDLLFCPSLVASSALSLLLWFSFWENSIALWGCVDMRRNCRPYSISAFHSPTFCSIVHLHFQHFPSPLYCTCLSNAVVFSGVLFIPPPTFFTAILPQHLFRFACLLLTKVYQGKGGSQSHQSSFITWSSLWSTEDLFLVFFYLYALSHASNIQMTRPACRWYHRNLRSTPAWAASMSNPPPLHPASSLRKSEIAVHIQPSSTSQSY